MTTEPIPPVQEDRHGPAAATVLVGALLVLVGIGWLLDAGGVEVPWRADSGFANRLDTTVEAGSDRRLELDLRVGIGQVRVER